MPEFWLLTLFVLLGLLVSGLLFGFIQIFNQLAANRDQVAKAFADIDVLLKQRRAELPALKSVLDAWTQHEGTIQESLAHWRERAQDSSGLLERLLLENELSFLLWGFLGRREANPELAATPQFANLQTRISDLESAINARRENFNAQVAGHNILLEQIPVRWVAPWLGHRVLPYLKDARA